MRSQGLITLARREEALDYWVVLLHGLLFFQSLIPVDRVYRFVVLRAACFYLKSSGAAGLGVKRCSCGCLPINYQVVSVLIARCFKAAAFLVPTVVAHFPSFSLKAVGDLFRQDIV